MIKNLAKSFTNIFNSFGKIVGLLIFCTVLGVAIVFPLWKFATAVPEIYSIVVLSLIFIFAIFACIKKIKSSGFSKFIISALKFLTIIGGIFSSIALVLNGQRVLAIPVIILMIVIYGFLVSKTKKENAK